MTDCACVCGGCECPVCRHEPLGNLRDLDSVVTGLWAWDFLNGCWPLDSIRPTDVDGVVERLGNLVLLEGGRDGKPPNVGQTRMFRTITDPERLKSISVIQMTGIPPSGPISTVKIWRWGHRPRVYEGDQLNGDGIAFVQDKVRAWSAEINNGGLSAP